FKVENGATRYPEAGGRDATALAVRARAVAEKHGVPYVAPAAAQAWVGDAARTTYLLDVRTAEEFAGDRVPGFVHAPGGQLIQATDQWVGVKGARLVLIDGEMVRAPMVAAWLRQLGHDACVIDGGVAASRALTWRRSAPARPAPLPTIAPAEAA